MSETFYYVTTDGKDFFSEEFLREELNVRSDDAEQRDFMPGAMTCPIRTV